MKVLLKFLDDSFQAAYWIFILIAIVYCLCQGDFAMSCLLIVLVGYKVMRHFDQSEIKKLRNELKTRKKLWPYITTDEISELHERRQANIDDFSEDLGHKLRDQFGSDFTITIVKNEKN